MVSAVSLLTALLLLAVGTFGDDACGGCGEKEECVETAEGMHECKCKGDLVKINQVCTKGCGCRVTGDPHIINYDGGISRFQGACTHILAQNKCKKGIPKRSPDWIVASKNSRRNDTRLVSWVNEVIITVGKNVVQLQLEGVVLVNGIRAEGLPLRVNSHIHIYDTPNYLNVQTDLGLFVQWDRKFSVRILVEASIGEDLCGMCGTCDGKTDNDMVTGPNTGEDGLCPLRLDTSKEVGDPVTNADVWGYSWMQEGDVSEECFEDCRRPLPPERCTEEEKKRVRKMCNIFKTKDGPFGECRKHPKGAFLDEAHKDCVYDACHLFNNLTEIVCGYGVQAAELCHDFTGNPVDWRSDDFCPIECPENSQYTTCLENCHPDCANPKGFNCPLVTTCIEGCECNKGYYYNNDTCMQSNECGCPDDETGSIIPIDSVVVRDNCTRECTCEESKGNVTCREFKCRDDQECSVINGIQTCTCPLDHSEVDGKCIPSATCRCTGDPHCDTFDDVHFSYQGSCKYTLAQDNCENGLPAGKPSFQVVINNDRVRPTKKASRVASVEIIIGKTNIYLGRGGIVTVNKAEALLPMFIDDAIRIFDLPNNVFLTYDGLTVMWDRVYSVKVKVAGNKFGQTCGLCGNYNGDESDDVVLGPTDSDTCTHGDTYKGTAGDKMKLEDEVIFGNSWFHSVDEDEKSCEEDCAELPHPSKCDDRKAVKRCERLKDKNGSMKKCLATMTNAEIGMMFQDCVFDTCETDIDGDDYVCSAAAATMEKCYKKGITENWRTEDFCPPDCPAHAEYKLCGDPCVRTCSDPTGLRCLTHPQPCQEGCFCKEGYVTIEGECYHEKECQVVRKPCRSLTHPVTGKKYDARVQCWTCENAVNEEECLKNGKLQSCLLANAICEVIRQEKSGRITRQCKARADCPQGSIGAEKCADGACSQCHYGDVNSNKEPTPLFRCQPYVDRSVCNIPKKTGEGDKELKRFYFSRRKCRCQTFTYFGSGGTANNFHSMEDCDEACGHWETPERCFEEPDQGTGSLDNIVKMYYYTHTSMKCKKLEYTGEGGNSNRFASKRECRRTCKKC